MSIETIDFDALIADKYRPIEWVGKGAMGRVLKAEDVTLNGLPVAIKLLAWQSKGDADTQHLDKKKRDLFQREMHAMVELYAHSYIVQVRDFGWLTEGTPYMVMGFMPHGSLKDRLATGQLEPSLSRRILEELCDALDYIHEQNVVHLDLKPSNILFDRRDHVRISDFGLARLTDDASTDFATAGTPGYMAPEQMQRDVVVDHRADVYALGVIACQLLTSQHPFESDVLSEGTLAPELVQPLRKALAQEPKDRYDSANKFLKAIKPWLPRTYPSGVVTADEHFGFLVTQVPFAYRENVRRVLQDYTSVFGGREPEMKSLNDWLSAPDQPCGIMQAPAGRGKTALLVNWALDVQGSGEWRVVFHPISIRYQTADVNAAVRCLAHALAPLFDSEPPGPNQSPDVIRPQITEWLRHGLPEDEQLLVIVDGLDEAVGWPVELLFPRTPGPGVRLLVSARPLAGTDRLAWATRLKWDVAAARFFDLGSLDRAALTEMLRILPDEDLSALANDDIFVTELLRVSEGDPLTARMIVDALRVGDLTPQSLSRRPPGLQAYLEDWLRELEDRAESEAAWRLLGLCAVALGPLTIEDLAALAPDVFKTSRHIRSAVRAVERFILGKGTPESGYVFSHPRLRELFGDELLASERATYQAAFIDYGQRVFDRLPDAPCPAYVRQFWMTHLAEAGEWDRLQAGILKRNETSGRYLWANTRYTAEGSYADFLADLDLAWWWAESHEGWSISHQIHFALIKSSVHSLAESISSESLFQLVKTGSWSSTTAIKHISLIPDERQRAVALAKIAVLLPDPLKIEALMIARGMVDKHARAQALSRLAWHLTDELKAEAVREALVVARELSDELVAQGFSDEWWRAEELGTVVKHLPDELKAEASAMVQSIANKAIRAKAFNEIAEHLPEELKAKVLSDALATARGIADEGTRARMLGALAGHLPKILKVEVVREAFSTARRVADERKHALTLIRLTEHLPDGLGTEVMREVLVAVQEIVGERERALALSRLARHLSDEVKVGALTVAREVADEWARAGTLGQMAKYLPDDLKAEVMREALAAAREIDDEGRRAKMLSELEEHLPDDSRTTEVFSNASVPVRGVADEWERVQMLSELAWYLPSDLKVEVVSDALSLARGVNDEGEHAQALIGLAEHLSTSLKVEVMREALAAVRKILTGLERAEILREIAEHLPDELKVEALIVARGISDDRSRAAALCRLACHMPGDLKAEVTSDALAAARRVDDEWDRAELLSELVGYLSDDLRYEVASEALTAARSVTDEGDRAELLGRLAAHLPDNLRHEVASEALTTARSVADEGDRAILLSTLVDCLTDELRPEVVSEALTATRKITDEWMYAWVLGNLAGHLPDNLRDRALCEVLSSIQMVALRNNSGFWMRTDILFAQIVSIWQETELSNIEDWRQIWSTTLRALTRHSRAELLRNLTVLVPLIAHLGGEEAVAKISRAIQNIGGAWL